MIELFKDKATADIFDGNASKQARKLDQLDSVITLEELQIPPGNRLEALSGDRSGSYSIRINQQYRISFKWENNGHFEVEVADYH